MQLQNDTAANSTGQSGCPKMTNIVSTIMTSRRTTCCSITWRLRCRYKQFFPTRHFPTRGFRRSRSLGIGQVRVLLVFTYSTDAWRGLVGFEVARQRAALVISPPPPLRGNPDSEGTLYWPVVFIVFIHTRSVVVEWKKKVSTYPSYPPQ